ncbi:MAG TPA: tetratricopeptide repeat protein [Pseudonocardiaceae bacterium]
MEPAEPLAERYERARMFFDAGDFITAARMLVEVVAEAPGDLSASLLLARAYYHSAQLHRAEAQARAILERHPAEEYAHLLLGRTLQRQSRHAEAVAHLRIAEAMSGQIIL